jgi:hypothetical protein
MSINLSYLIHLPYGPKNWADDKNLLITTWKTCEKSCNNTIQSCQRFLTIVCIWSIQDALSASNNWVCSRNLMPSLVQRGQVIWRGIKLKCAAFTDDDDGRKMITIARLTVEIMWCDRLTTTKVWIQMTHELTTDAKRLQNPTVDFTW